MDSGKSKKSPLPLIAVIFLALVLGALFFGKDWLSKRSGGQQAIEVIVTPITSQALIQRIDQSQAQVKLVNMWATWCAPCIEEFPYIMQLGEKYKDQGLELYLVSMDMDEDLEKAKQFLRTQNVDFETYFKNENDNDFISQMHDDWSGALPATFIYDKSAELKDFWTGDASFEEFEKATLGVLNPQK